VTITGFRPLPAVLIEEEPRTTALPNSNGSFGYWEGSPQIAEFSIILSIQSIDKAFGLFRSIDLIDLHHWKIPRVAFRTLFITAVAFL
jgi:hypothetical protein